MKAATIGRYGSPGVIEVRDVPEPVPGPDEVLVRVHAATVNRSDCGELLHPTIIRLLTSGGTSRRTILGMDFAGTIEAVGASASLFKPGDRVFGMCPFRNDGAQAEYFCMAETGLIALMPSNLRFDQAVICEGAFYANPTIEHFALKPGHRILIYGASGAIGTAALQLAKDRGAEVVAVVAGRHLGLARSLGADLAVDYTTDAFDQLGRNFDFVLDAVGKLGIRRWRRWLKPGGVFAATDRGPWSQNLLFLLWSKVTGNGRVVVPLAKRGSGQAFVNELRDRIEAGRFRSSIADILSPRSPMPIDTSRPERRLVWWSSTSSRRAERRHKCSSTPAFRSYRAPIWRRVCAFGWTGLGCRWIEPCGGTVASSVAWFITNVCTSGSINGRVLRPSRGITTAYNSTGRRTTLKHSENALADSVTQSPRSWIATTDRPNSLSRTMMATPIASAWRPRGAARPADNRGTWGQVQSRESAGAGLSH